MSAIEAAGRGMMAAATRLDGAATVLAASLSGNDDAAKPQTPPAPAHLVQENLIAGGFDPIEAAVDGAEALTAFKANVAAFDTADRMMKAVLDIKV